MALPTLGQWIRGRASRGHDARGSQLEVVARAFIRLYISLYYMHDEENVGFKTVYTISYYSLLRLAKLCSWKNIACVGTQSSYINERRLWTSLTSTNVSLFFSSLFQGF